MTRGGLSWSKSRGKKREKWRSGICLRSSSTESESRRRRRMRRTKIEGELHVFPLTISFVIHLHNFPS